MNTSAYETLDSLENKTVEVSEPITKKRSVTNELLETLSKLSPEDITAFRLEKAKWRSLTGPWFECEITTKSDTYLMDFSRHILRDLSNLHPCIPKEFSLEKWISPRKPTIIDHQLHSLPDVEVKKAYEIKLPIPQANSVEVNKSPQFQSVTYELLEALSQLRPEDISSFRLEKPVCVPLIGYWFECEINTDTKTYLMKLSKHMLRDLANLHSLYPEEIKEKWLNGQEQV